MSDLTEALDGLFALEYDEGESEWESQEVHPQRLWTVLYAARRWAKVEPLLTELRAAIEDEGPFPQHHRQVMIRHRREWPTLWNVLVRLVPVSDGERLER